MLQLAMDIGRAKSSFDHCYMQAIHCLFHAHTTSLETYLTGDGRAKVTVWPYIEVEPQSRDK